MKERDKYKNLFDGLIELEKSNQLFSKKELSVKTGYSEGSIGVYIRNKLKNIYIFEDKSGKYYVQNILQTDYSTFSDFMSQKSRLVKYKSSLFNSLIERSIEAFYNSIIIYNNPVIEYRIESFCILLINSWELLLKARIIELHGEKKIFRKDGKSISFTQSLEMIFNKKNDPIRLNLETINELRDQAVHLLVPDIQATLSRLFQSSIFNFLKTIKSFNYPNPYSKETPGLMSFITDKDDVEDRIIIQKYGKMTSEEIKRFKQNITQIENNTNDENYIIPLGYKIILTKKENEGDIKISTSPDGESAMLIKVPKDNNKTHPFRPKDVISKINEKYQETILNSYSFRAIEHKEKIRSSNQNKYYFLIENPKTHKYSQEFVDLIIHKIENSDSYLESAKEQFKKYNRQNNKKLVE